MPIAYSCTIQLYYAAVPYCIVFFKKPTRHRISHPQPTPTGTAHTATAHRNQDLGRFILGRVLLSAPKTQKYFRKAISRDRGPSPLRSYVARLQY